MKQPFFSIVIPTLNRAEDLRLAITCIMQQTFSNFEIVVSDNHSNDHTKQIVQSFQNKKIHYFRNDKQLLIDESQKVAISRARGKYVFLHGDDDFLPYTETLQVVFEEIKKHKSGYIRVNYLCLSNDGRRIFTFGTHPFVENQYLKAGESNEKVISFILKSSNCFITGIVFQNNYQKHASMLSTDPCPWINILFYSTKNHGASIIVSTPVIARWSRNDPRPGSKHHLFTLTNGQLKSIGYFNALKKILPLTVYRRVLHRELMGIYVIPFPVIKVKAGVIVMVQIAIKVLLLDTSMRFDMRYWANLLFACMIPTYILHKMKNFYLSNFVMRSTPKNNADILEKLIRLDHEYGKRRLFNFS